MWELSHAIYYQSRRQSYGASKGPNRDQGNGSACPPGIGDTCTGRVRKAAHRPRGLDARCRSSSAPPERSGEVILVDTSIWIDHFRYGDAELSKVIKDDRLLCHPAIIGEIALGSLRDRDAVIAFLAAQREAFVA